MTFLLLFSEKIITKCAQVKFFLPKSPRLVLVKFQRLAIDQMIRWGFLMLGSRPIACSQNNQHLKN
ncbi:hypothetical protein DC094_16000 [Pelagibaculum spongiae]|uniref:Uncharacterized protein n=1 Tax=Pelagibaculum spongiae TaxID=2080658 RepID=A0A2V1GXV1_9GAMM|nr:hypothetical protein DC094_16000 [Pelagibaculum spongiae]